MLEFQEGFFDQEVRDGFYLDTTMKTLWAAELEVLQKVAEICDRHGLKWYAAYGTLLGAIRHEGFVPWDDDMDIWVKRPDYNILMQVLPKELPEGYLVRSPMTDEGYEQFHTCLNSGNGISISKEWLEQFHGCPFTVGLDIFPLDYLPRDEKDRELQENLLAMTGRIAQLAKNISRGDYDSEDGEDKQPEGQNKGKKRNGKKAKKKSLKESIVEEINLGIDYLEENCKLEIDHQLLEDENWGKVSSELWKWANYLAMMYGEDESDYIVEMFDYIQCPHKVYPKEWFADGYSATFENFMIPIPAGYHQILQYIYGLEGDYLMYVRKTGTHEYPFYARQLRQLRQYVRDIQQRAQDVGLVSIDQIEVKEETKELLPEWIPLTMKSDGSRKKIVLSANDPAVYATYGAKALNKLENTLQSFEKVKDSVLLWWRPQPVMKKVLEQISPELEERYQKILNCYKKSGWGICDETDNVDRAVEACDIYFGDMNAIIQPFQNLGKPVMLTSMDNQKAKQENIKRMNENKVFLSMPDFITDEKNVFFANANYNALVIADKVTGTIVKHIPLKGYGTDICSSHLKCALLQNRIYLLPAAASCLHIYDIRNDEQKVCYFLDQKETPDTQQNSWNYFLCDEYMYLLPSYSKKGMWRIAVQEDEPSKEGWWNIPIDDNTPLRHDKMDENRFYTWGVNTHNLYITNIVNHIIEHFSLPDEAVQHITYDGENFWYTIKGASDIICWNSDNGIINRYFVSYDPFYIVSSFWNNVRKYAMETYQGICYAGEKLFLISGDGKFLYVLDQKIGELRTLYAIKYTRGPFSGIDVSVCFKHIGNTLVCIFQNTSELLTIHLETLDVRQISETFYMDYSQKKIINEHNFKLLIDRKALIYEEDDVADLQILL